VEGQFATGDHALHISEICEDSDDQLPLGPLVPYGDDEPGLDSLVRAQVIVRGHTDHFLE
jgi:hypothetical protein